jgi:hypothetical protein
VSPTLVSLVVVGVINPIKLSSQQSPLPSVMVPLFSVAVPSSVERYTMVPVNPLLPGVGGWVVFGSGVSRDPYYGRFSSPATQSLLSPQAARGLEDFPVSGMGVDGAATPLTGLVRLSAAPPLQLKRETRVIDGASRTAVVCSLALADISEGEMGQLVGPCGRRPEASNCDRPIVRSIGQVSPDCDGLVTLEFEAGGCITAYQHEDRHGITLDCGISLSDVCQPPSRETLPDAQGRLPNESRDNCDPNSEYFGQPVQMAAPVWSEGEPPPATDLFVDKQIPPPSDFRIGETDDRFEVVTGMASYMVMDPTDLRKRALWFSGAEQLTTVLFDTVAIPTAADLLWVLEFSVAKNGREQTKKNLFLGVLSTDRTSVTALLDWDARQMTVSRTSEGQSPVPLFVGDLREDMLSQPGRIFLQSSLHPRDGLAWFRLAWEGRSLFEGAVGPWDSRWQKARWRLGEFQSPLLLWDVKVARKEASSA